MGVEVGGEGMLATRSRAVCAVTRVWYATIKDNNLASRLRPPTCILMCISSTPLSLSPC